MNHKLEVCAVSVVLNIMLSPTAVMASCPNPLCTEGMFVTRNCSESKELGVGVQCKPCTDCSALNWSTVVPCSLYADSVCGSSTTSTATGATAFTPVIVSSPFPDWIISTAVFVSVFLFLLILVLAWLFRRKHPENDVYLA